MKEKSKSIREEKSQDIREYNERIQYQFAVPNQFMPEEIWSKIRVLTSIQPKLILSGSLSLHALHLTNLDFTKRTPDFDFALREPLTEDEFLIIKSLFNLKTYETKYEEDKESVHQLDILKRDLIVFVDEKAICIDIFNKEYQSDINKLYPVNFGNNITPHIVYCQHPSITIAHKMKYAFLENYHKKNKHHNDCVDFICKDYDKIISRLHFLNEKQQDFRNYINKKVKPTVFDNLQNELDRLF
jgi:hypothetical protein